ncbi:MAG: hypothetical protein AAF846_28535 [Chloroflexota bacterium]
MQLSTGQKWALGALVCSAATFTNIFFVPADIQIYGFMMIGLAFAAFSIVMSGDSKRKSKDGS